MEAFHASPADRLFPEEGGTIEKFEHSRKPSPDHASCFIASPPLGHTGREFSERLVILLASEPPTASQGWKEQYSPLRELVRFFFFSFLFLQYNGRLNSHSNSSAGDESVFTVVSWKKDEITSLISHEPAGEVAAGPVSQAEPKIGMFPKASTFCSIPTHAQRCSKA